MRQDAEKRRGGWETARTRSPEVLHSEMSVKTGRTGAKLDRVAYSSRQ
jgi:hypothetical protein